MTAWIITQRARREYCALRGWDHDGDRAERVLLDELARAHEIGEQDNGLVMFRGAKPARLRLFVSAENELVSVLAGHDGIQRAAAPRGLTIQVLDVSRDQLDAWTRAAGGRKDLSRWMRDACDRAARKESAR